MTVCETSIAYYHIMRLIKGLEAGVYPGYSQDWLTELKQHTLLGVHITRHDQSDFIAICIYVLL